MLAGDTNGRAAFDVFRDAQQWETTSLQPQETAPGNTRSRATSAHHSSHFSSCGSCTSARDRSGAKTRHRSQKKRGGKVQKQLKQRKVGTWERGEVRELCAAIARVTRGAAACMMPLHLYHAPFSSKTNER